MNRIVNFIFLFLAVSFTTQSSLLAKTTGSEQLNLKKYPLSIEPEQRHYRVIRYATHSLKSYHVNGVNLDDSSSPHVLKIYLDKLDPYKVHFTQNEIDDFLVLNDKMDDIFWGGTIQPLYQIYSHSNLRMKERYTHLKKLSEQSKALGTLTLDESIISESWAASRSALERRWEKQFVNEVRELGEYYKNDEEIRAVLTERYSQLISSIDTMKPQDAFNVIVNSATQFVDPHTSYFSPRSTATSENKINYFDLVGIGLVLEKQGIYTKISQIVEAGPSDQTGKLKVGFQILSIAEEGESKVDIVGWRLEDVINKIRGKDGSKVTLTVRETDGTVGEVVIKRERVKLQEPKVFTKIIERANKKIAVITINRFALDFSARESGAKDYESTSRELKNAFQKLSSKNIDGYIIDLTKNGGGSLSESIDSLGVFFDSRPVLQERDRRNKITVLKTPKNDNPIDKYNIVVLVSAKTAGGAEIFAAGLQDYGRAVVVGQRTYGMGTIQNVIDLGYAVNMKGAGALKITSAEYYRVTGKGFQKLGVTPDVEFLDSTKINQGKREEEKLNALPNSEIKEERAASKDLEKEIEVLKGLHSNRMKTEKSEITLLEQSIQVLLDRINKSDS
jgi:carboxyl-terminal processing protease